MIDENINYKDLAQYVRLAIEEYEFYNRDNIEGYSFSDLTDWLDHFGYLDANTTRIKRSRK